MAPSGGSKQSRVGRPQSCPGQGGCEPQIPENVLQEVSSTVWSDGRPGRAARATPVQVLLRPHTKAPALRQRRLKRHEREVMDRLIADYLKYGLIRPCRSPYNTPVFLQQEQATKEYRVVQDLRAINKAMGDVGSGKPNAYTLLNRLSGDFGWFTVLSLRDAFYCIPLSKESQELFAFRWGGPESGGEKQYCWTVLPLGFKNTPTIFEDVFAKDLRDLQLEEGILLQYLGNILIASTTWESSHKNTVRTLNFLAERGYKVCKKAQFSQRTVRYLGLELSRGQRRLLPEQSLALAGVARPTTRKQLRTFLGKVGFCRIWVPNFGLIVRPLCEALKGGESFNWTAECSRAFDDIRDRVARAPALGLPDLRKPFNLFVHEHQGVGLGVLTQGLGSSRHPIAYCSKQLDTVALSWPVCLQAVAATYELLQQARKFTEGRPVTVHTPHDVLSLLEQKERRWLTTARLQKYQGSLLASDVRLKTASALDPATLLPRSRGAPAHDCMRVIAGYSSRADLTTRPLEYPDLEMFTAGSSFMEWGLQQAVYTITSLHGVVETGALPPGTSAQQAELIALTRALCRGRQKRVNLYTDSEIALSVVYARGAMWARSRLLTAEGREVRHAEEIMDLLHAVLLPKEVAIVHCPGHQEAEGIAVGQAHLARSEGHVQDLGARMRLLSMQTPL